MMLYVMSSGVLKVGFGVLTIRFASLLDRSIMYVMMIPFLALAKGIFQVSRIQVLPLSICLALRGCPLGTA